MAVTGLLPCNAPPALEDGSGPFRAGDPERKNWATNAIRGKIATMATPLKNLTPRHEYALRLIALGLPVGEAAQVIGISEPRMSWIYHSTKGRAFILALYAAANDYTARMLALGLTPRHISAAPGGGKHASKVRPPRKRRVQPSDNAGGDEGAGGVE